MAILLPAACAACGSPSAAPDPTPAVAVTTTPAREGATPRWITAYGTATPAANGTRTVSVNQPGQVRSISVTQGAAVRAGQTLLVFEIAPSARAGYEAAATALAAARRQRDTTRRLLDQQLATNDQLVQAEKAVADAAAALDAQRLEGAGRATQTLTAPFDGIVTAVPVAVGDRTQPGAALATVARRGGIVVTVGVAPDERDAVGVGAAARLAPLDGGRRVDGAVLRVDAQINPTTRLVDVDLRFPAGALMPGEPLRAEIAAGRASGWLVPHVAVATDGAGPHVFQVLDRKAHAVPVAVVQSSADIDVVRGALEARLPLVVDGAYQVADGDAVRLVPR